MFSFGDSVIVDYNTSIPSGSTVTFSFLTARLIDWNSLDDILNNLNNALGDSADVQNVVKGHTDQASIMDQYDVTITTNVSDTASGWENTMIAAWNSIGYSSISLIETTLGSTAIIQDIPSITESIVGGAGTQAGSAAISAVGSGISSIFGYLEDALIVGAIIIGGYMLYQVTKD